MSYRHVVIAAAVTLPLWVMQSVSAKSEDLQRIMPTQVTITGPNGETYPIIPLRFYFEYGHGTAKSTSDPLSTVNIDRDRYTVGGDFMTSWVSFLGGNVQFARVHDAGTQPFVFSLDTQKDFIGGQFYFAHYVAPLLLAGISTEYHSATGRSIYNHFDVNHEDSRYYSFTPFLMKEYAVNASLLMTFGAGINFNHANYSYDLNIPPTASTRSTILRLPVGAEYQVTRNWVIGGSAQFNHIMSIENFRNVPAPDRSTLTLTAATRYTFDSGMSIYGNISHDVLDDAYDSTRFTVGMSVPFYWLAGRAQDTRPLTPRIVK